MTTFATIDIANLTVAFHATSDDAMHVSDERDHYAATCAEDLQDLSGTVLVALYNATAAELDTNITPVKKFSGKEVGAKRLWANLVDLAEVYAERHAKVLEENRKVAEVKPAPAPKKARQPVAEGREVWRRAKREPAQKVAYRPLPGSVQDGLYVLLTAEGGMTMEDYCAGAKLLKTRDGTLFTPPQVWGALRYLFVTKRGYGLDFDGKRIRLLVPADERSTGKQA